MMINFIRKENFINAECVTVIQFTKQMIQYAWILNVQATIKNNLNHLKNIKILNKNNWIKFIHVKIATINCHKNISKNNKDYVPNVM